MKVCHYFNVRQQEIFFLYSSGRQVDLERNPD